MQHDSRSGRLPSEGMFSSIKNFTASLVSHLHTRLQLFAAEYAEEKLRLTSLLLSAFSALFFLFMAIALAAVFVIAVAWDTAYRLHAVGGLILFFLAGAGLLWGIFRAKLKEKPHLFQASLAELYKDRQQLSAE